MKKCVICRNEILNENPAVFFEGAEGEPKEICSNCEKQIDIMMESDNIEEAKSAINYLYTCYLTNGDDEVKQVLRSSLDENSREIVLKEKEQASEKPVDSTNVADYFIDNNELQVLDMSKWHKFIWVGTIVYVTILAIVTITVIFTSGALGILLGAIYLFAILMLIAMVKVILNLSTNVTDIKRIMIEKDKLRQ